MRFARPSASFIRTASDAATLHVSSPYRKIGQASYVTTASPIVIACVFHGTTGSMAHILLRNKTDEQVGAEAAVAI